MTETTRRIAELAKEHAAAWSKNKPEKIGMLFTERGSITVNGGEPHVGRDAIVESAKQLLAAFPGLEVHCEATRHAGRRAVFVWTLLGRHAESGNDVVLPGWHEWEINDDMGVTRCRGFYDAEDLQRQIDRGQ